MWKKVKLKPEILGPRIYRTLELYFSTLLSLLLNELEIKNGSFDRFESFGYASQEAWMIAGTIKENILMGRKFDKAGVRKLQFDWPSHIAY